MIAFLTICRMSANKCPKSPQIRCSRALRDMDNADDFSVVYGLSRRGEAP